MSFAFRARLAAAGNADNFPQPSAGTVYGVNTALTSWSGGVNEAYATRGSWFGRIPCGRGYVTPLPSSGNFTSGGNEWGWAGGTYGEKRLNMCFKFTDTDMAHQLAIGTYDTTISSYINSVPSDWTVFLTFYHEFNIHIDSNNTAADFVAAFTHFGQLVAANNPSGNVIPTICGSSYNWDNSGCPSASNMPANTLFIMDDYGNPNGVPSGYKNYGTTYPTVASCIDAWYSSIVGTLGYTHWGIGEFNAPQRVAPALSSLNTSLGWGPQSPHDINGTVRAQWLTDYCNYMQAKPIKPELVLLWEGGNGNWNQYFTTAGDASYDDGTSSNPGANYQGWPINIDSTPLIAAYKSFVTASP